VRIACWQYPIEQQASMAAWRTKIDSAIGDAAGQGADVVVVPEYASMELTSLLAATEQTLDAQLIGMQRLLAEYDASYVDVAKKHRIAIVAGSFPVRGSDGAYRNRALVIGPDGAAVPVEKLQMTRFENERWGITAGAGQAVFAIGELRLGVAICYDAEFPLISRRLALAGANVIAVPSCTDGLAGYHRVKVASLARALENQCYVAQAPTVGIAPWSIAVDENVGAAGVFAPCDRGFPDDGVIALGTLNAAQMLVADIDLARVAAVRADGQVLGHRDWGNFAHLTDAAPAKHTLR
jgi:predicted amidohydrolase